MKIKGYTPPNKEAASETGVEFKYAVSVGDEEYNFIFQAKYSGTENKAFQKAAEKLNHKRDIRKKTKYKQTTSAALREMLELWFDHIIVSWDNDVSTEDDDGNAVPCGATKDTFIDLLSMDLFIGVYLSLQDDCADYTKFGKAAEAKAAKN